jgi:hypothetical protein
MNSPKLAAVMAIPMRYRGGYGAPTTNANSTSWATLASRLVKVRSSAKCQIDRWTWSRWATGQLGQDPPTVSPDDIKGISETNRSKLAVYTLHLVALEDNAYVLAASRPATRGCPTDLAVCNFGKSTALVRILLSGTDAQGITLDDVYSLTGRPVNVYRVFYKVQRLDGSGDSMTGIYNAFGYHKPCGEFVLTADLDLEARLWTSCLATQNVKLYQICGSSVNKHPEHPHLPLVSEELAGRMIAKASKA